MRLLHQLRPTILPPDPVRSIDNSLAFYADLVKETELRRRVNVLFPNPQSIFGGMQVGYVSVQHGNLTFRRRDMVAGTNPLAKFTRVYDSHSQRGRDFGLGWSLSFDEELTISDGGLVYRAGSGARHSFKRTGPDAVDQIVAAEESLWGAGGEVPWSAVSETADIYRAVPSTPQFDSTYIAIAGGVAILHKRGETRLFERRADSGEAENTYRLARIVSGGKQIVLSYRNGLIDMVSDGDGWLFAVNRDGVGRIVSAQDRWGREVHYRYDLAGRLREAQDIGGNTWSYEYGVHGGLTRAMGPNGRDILRTRYDGERRVKGSVSGQQYSFTYAEGETVVVEGTGHSHVFGQNVSGITDSFESTNGVWWQLALDARNRVTEVRSSNGDYQYSYASNGAIARVDERSADSRNTRLFEYDAQGRITSINSEQGASTTVEYSAGFTRIVGPDTQVAFDVLPSGRIGFAGREETFISADYDSNGNPAAFRSGGNTVEIGRDSMGRLAQVRYPNGEQNRYRYDALGNRTAVTFGSGGATRYVHDPAGNIVEVVVTEADGEEKRQKVEVGDMNRVERITYEGLGRLHIVYDSMGRAVRFDTDRDVIRVEYASPSAIGRIVSQASGAEWSPDAEAGGNSSNDADFRLEVLQLDSIPTPHPHYGILGFSEISFEAIAGDPMERRIPGLSAARRLLKVGEPLFADDVRDAMMELEKPSNPVFQPLEYRSTNCCICIIVYPAWSLGNDGAAASLPGNDEPICICAPTSPSQPPPAGLPPYKEPQRPSIPEAEITDGFLGAWGTYDFDAVPAVYCQGAVGTNKARLEGEINVTENRIQVTTKIRSPDTRDCQDGTRTTDNINRTIRHEQRHAEAYVQLVNDHLDKLGVEYPNASICAVQAQEFEKNFNTDLVLLQSDMAGYKP